HVMQTLHVDRRQRRVDRKRRTKSGQLRLTVQRVVVDGDLRVEGNDHPTRQQRERVDLDQGGVRLADHLIHLGQRGGCSFPRFRRQVSDQESRLVGLQPQNGIYLGPPDGGGI